MRHFGRVLAAAVTVLAVAATPVYAEAPKDQAALSGLKEVKVAFDLQSGDGKTLLKQLEVIDETRQSLIEQGVKPQFVLTFRGPATALVQTDQSQIKPENRDYASMIAEKIRALRAADGINSIEQCAVAVRLSGTKPENVVPDVKVVGNGWISLMAYQAKGYGYIQP
jgi:intracellular sulfur oxidation DsrE/DsrF family protein